MLRAQGASQSCCKSPNVVFTEACYGPGMLKQVDVLSRLRVRMILVEHALQLDSQKEAEGKTYLPGQGNS